MKNLFTSLLFISLLHFGLAQESKTPFSVDELVLFTLVDQDLRYEIRFYQGKHIKTYEIKNGEETYLGKFMNLAEVERSEPYKSLLQHERNSSKTFVTDGYLGNEFYEIYIHNLFDAQKAKPVFVEVLKVEGQNSEVVSKYEKETDFNESRFAPLLYRD